MDRSGLAYWDQFAGDFAVRRALVQPGGEDLAWFEAAMQKCARSLGGAPLKAVLLGVTPGIAGLNWPEDASLVALDWSAQMIRRVWPGAARAAFAAPVKCDWRSLPLDSATADVALGDSWYVTLASLGEIARVAEEVRRVLRPGGVFLVRGFVGPEQPERVEDMFEQLFAGQVQNLNVFRWRLAAALQAPAPTGVPLDAVWRVWHAHVPDFSVLVRRFGRSADEARGFERWKGRPERFCYSSLAALTEAFAPHFDVVERHFPGYDLGRYFPRLVMRARQAR